MAQFDVFRLPGRNVLVVDIQSELVEDLDTRAVIPLVPAGSRPWPISRLHPEMKIGDEKYLLATQLIGAVQRNLLVEPFANLVAERDRIVAAVDMLVTGI